MAKKYPRSEAIRDAQNKNELGFMSWEPGDTVARQKALAEGQKAVHEYTAIHRSQGSFYDGRFIDYSNLLPGISARPGMTRGVYDFFRPAEASPTAYRDIIVRCNSVYENVGLIKNIIDLMGDFACQGVRIVHPNKKVEKFYKNWFTKVSGVERSERFLNYLYRTGNVIVRRQTAKVNVTTIKKLYKAQADPDLTNEDIKPQFEVIKKEIPWKYNFIDPATTIIVGGALSSFVGDPLYAIILPDNIRRQILSPRTAGEKAIVAQLPDDIIQAANTKTPYILPKEKTVVYHYKKDDWAPWAMPMIYSVLRDVVLLDKLKLADSAALDGATSNIRIFKLGNIEKGIVPTAYAAQKLNELLQSNTGGGTMDLIWGADLELVESKSEVYKFLGEAKYTPHLNAIYAGLGIPPSLTGTGEGGTTNNFMSLKTLTERLEYGRGRLVEFWTTELEIVRKAMGFSTAAKVEFDIMNLGDEANIKALYRDLADRNILSDEAVQRFFKADPEMETVRINREAKARDTGKMVNKAGPYYEPQAQESLKKIALQQGTVTPSQVGLDMPEPKDGEMPMMDKKHEQDMAKQELVNKAKEAQKKLAKGPAGTGRPKNSKDSSKRKKKVYSPRGKAALQAWARSAQNEIAEILNPALFSYYKKRNARMLSTTEAEHSERVKFGVLCNMEPFGEVNEKTIHVALGGIIPQAITKKCTEYAAEMASYTKKTPTLDDMKQIQACAYADYHGEDEE